MIKAGTMIGLSALGGTIGHFIPFVGPWIGASLGALFGFYIASK